jgi:hypothetical protein
METLISRPAKDLAGYPTELAAFTPQIVDGCPVSAASEPLLRERDRRLWQAIRVQVGDRELPRVTVLDAGGATVDCERIDLGVGAARLLVPAVDRPTELTVALHFIERPVHVPVVVEPQRRWTVHLVHHSHFDIGYTDPQRVVLREQLGYLDACLELARRTDELPEDARFRWTVESLWIYERWAAQRDPALVADFLDRVREGRFELTALPFTLHTETCSVDELHELLRAARELRRQHGVPMSVAMQTDVPGMVVGAVDALADAGVRYLSVAHNWAGRSMPHQNGGQRLPRLFRWRAPSGRSLLVWHTDTAHGWYVEGNFVGLDDGYDRAVDLLPTYLSRLANEPYPYSVQRPKFLLTPIEGPLVRQPYPWDVLHLRVQGRNVDNGPPSDSLPELVQRWNSEWMYPRLRLSRNEDFFAEVERRFGDEVETFDGDWSDWWADGIGSAAQPLACTRDAQRAVAEGQHLEAIARLLGAEADFVGEPIRAAYRAISLFNEHTWGAANPWTSGEDGIDSGQAQWHWKAARALEAAERSGELAVRGAVRVGRALGRGEGSLAAVYAINPSGEARTDLVAAFVSDALVDRDATLAVRDARSGRVVPHEEEREGSLSRRPGRHLTFRADEVAPCGLARFDLVPAEVPASAVAQPSAPQVLENEHLRVELDLRRACVGALVDKTAGRDLARPDALVGLNGYVYDRYGSVGRANLLSSLLSANSDLSLLAERHAGADAAIVGRRTTAVADEVTYEFRPPGADRVRVTARLPHGLARLDLVNAIDKRWTDDKESAFFAFPFAIDDPTVRLEATGGVIGPELDVVPGSATHMHAIRRWASFEGADGRAVAWATHDAPLVQHGEIALPYAPFPATTPGGRQPATLYSWIHNNVWDTNFPPGQSLSMRFRYSIGVGPGPGPVLGVRTAAGGGRPMTAIVTARTDLPAREGATLAAVDDERVRVVGLAPAADGDILLRLQSFAEEAVALNVQLPAGRDAAWHAAFTGERGDRLPVEGGAVRVEIAPCATLALLIAP